MNGLLDGLKALGLPRLAAMGAVALGMLGLLGFLALRGSAQPMTLLYGDLDLREAGQMADTLDKAHIAHREGGGGTRMLVPSDQVDRARLLLAKDGLPSGGSIGNELFDRSDSLTTTQFQQTINQERALEGELARTIRGIAGVRAVRLHIVLPHREPFQQQQQDAQASVMLTMAGAARLDREGVQAVLNLVSAAVPGLHPQNIAIIDNRGDVLARAGRPAGAAAAIETGEDLRHAIETKLDRAVEDMLEPTLGAGRVRAEATVDMDFDQLRQTEESYNPDQQVVRSSQTTNDTSKTTEAAKTVSVQNNLPNADAGQPAPAGTQEQKQEETTNYEIGKTVRTMVREHPQIRRLSLAVLVDGVATPGPDGKPAWHDRTPEELARITTLVRSAVGYDEKRGDKVEVVSMRFAAGDDAAAQPAPPAGLLGLDRGDIVHLAETALFGVIALLALLLVVRPMAMRITPQPSPASLGAADAAALEPGSARAIAAAGGLAALPAPAGGADDSMVDLVNVEGQLKASSIRRIAELVDRHPEASLSIMRGWMTQEGSGA